VTIWKLFHGPVANVSTAEFHADRPRARHVDDPHHRPRLLKAAEYVREAAALLPHPSVSDLGCGDGGLLSLLPDIEAWGYDFQPSNADGWAERGVKAETLDVFGADEDRVRFGSISVATEVLEHISDPMGAVRWIAARSKYLVASSPWVETAKNHDDCHAWAFDPMGYQELLTSAGLAILRHELVGNFQIVLAMAT
jgi:hypothetical protein